MLWISLIFGKNIKLIKKAKKVRVLKHKMSFRGN